MAIAGFQNMCGFNSIHGESQNLPSGPWINHDRTGYKASTVMKMWREMEREHVVSHSHTRDRFRRHNDKSDVSNVDTASTISIDRQDSEDSLSDYSVIVQDCGVCDGQRPTLCDQDDRNSCSSELTDDIDEVDRERVRQIFQDWHTKNGVIRGPVSKNSHVSSENEFERVRIVRKWVKMNGQHRGSGSREKQNNQNVVQINQLQDGSVSNDCEVSGRRRIRKIYGRQTLVELLAMAEKERKRELEELSQRQPVTCFAHRNRIQSLLRGRFLQSGRLVQDKEPSSSAASELGLLRKKLPVSGLREGFLSRLDNLDAGSQSHSPSICSNNNNTFSDGQVDIIDEISVASADIAITMQEATVELHVQQIIEDSNVGSVDRKYEDTCNVIIKEVGEHSDYPLHEQGEASSSNMVGYDSPTTPSTTNNEDEEWSHNDIQSAQVIQELPEEEEQWEDDENFDSSPERSSSAAAAEEEEDVIETETTNFPNDDDIVYNNAELQELSNRRQVSNLLSSEFRHSLDRILISYAERLQTAADGTSDEWESDGTSSSFMELPLEEEEEELIDDSTWSRRLRVRQRGRIEWEVINDLRIEMGMLQKQLNEMQRMLESFMDMQMELQQSIREEVVSAAATAALNYRFLSKELQLSQSQQHHSSLHSG
ncbi:uncharacterized protein LOC124927315 [Impatiens glandulifera]|uniref:uncharacterized protein LOC124927315 n=1 Tax=Impatiens glandulifera TaxID=253017 RepID=UPI001FB19E9D|nr:uncharacterized protein LOC124927315 [Impatiens glandulifera]